MFVLSHTKLSSTYKEMAALDANATLGKATNSQVALASNAAISSSMALSHLGFPTSCCGCLIHDILCSYYCFSPKVIWQILLIQHGTCYFFNVPVFPFSNSILLRGIIT